MNVSPETVRQYAEEGRIPFVETPGGHRRYALEDVKHALRMEKARKFETLDEGEQELRLAGAHAEAGPIKRAPRWEAMTAAAIIADADRQDAKDGQLSIPFIGKPGTSRFIVGRGALA